MRYAIIADIHSNLAAFKAVLDDIESNGGAEEIWCLGDIVGYGPQPHQCIELLRRYRHVSVAGNHDWAATGKIDTSEFNPEAAAAARWTASQLTTEDIDYLNSLPLIIEKADFTLVHGSPRDPIWEYVISSGIARDNFAYFKSNYCLIGHSHVPLVFEEVEGGHCVFKEFATGVGHKLSGNRLFINPGGVGQPRDGDPRASYAIYESDASLITHYRIPYDISATQALMQEFRLPRQLILRLDYGY